jgi:hypothetical protein
VTAKRKGKTTTPSRPHKETVAEEPFATSPDDPATSYYDARNDEGEFAVEAPDTSPAAPTAPVGEPPVVPGTAPSKPVDPVAPKGYCDNHPGRAAVFVTNFSWAQPQRFCAQCLPAQYKPLMQ